MTKYVGDFQGGSVVRIKFNTLSQALVPTTPSVAMAFAVYKNSTTEITAGVTVTTDYDGKAGLHMVVIDTSADPAYTTGEDYDVVFTAGTVDGKDLTRVVLRTFSIENRNRRANVVQIAGQTANASAAVTFPASVANETTVAARASQTSVDGKPTLAQIEASTVLAKEATVAARPTLTQMEASTVLAKEATVTAVGTVASSTLSGVNALLSRITTSVAAMFVDLIAMITGSGTAAVKWTSSALSNAPAGGGGGGGGDPWSTDLPAGNYTGNQAGAIVQAIAAKTNTITAGKVSYLGPVTAKGRIDQVVIGDDYLAAHGTSFVWTIDAIAGMSAAAVTVHFGGKCGTNTFSRTGTASDLGNGKWSLVVEMPRADSVNLIVGEYVWSVEVRNAAGVELTRIYYDEPFVAVEKFT